MTDEQLTRLPPKNFKYEQYRAAVEWGIEQGLVRRPGEHLVVPEKVLQLTRKRQDLMAKAQAIRLSKTKVDSSRYYRSADPLAIPTNEPEAQM